MQNIALYSSWTFCEQLLLGLATHYLLLLIALVVTVLGNSLPSVSQGSRCNIDKTASFYWCFVPFSGHIVPELQKETAVILGKKKQKMESSNAGVICIRQ